MVRENTRILESPMARAFLRASSLLDQYREEFRGEGGGGRGLVAKGGKWVPLSPPDEPYQEPTEGETGASLASASAKAC